MAFEIKLTDNSGLYLEALESQKQAALEAVGQECESIAKQNLNEAGKVDTGNLMNSINHQVRMDEDAVYVGTNVEYGKYIEFGTGIYGEKGGTGTGWWVYVPGSSGGKHSGKRYTEPQARQIVARMRAQGIDAYMTQGQKPTHFLKRAAQDNRGTYEHIVKQQLQK